MTSIKRLFKRWAEKYAGRYYEGPEPPPRLARMAEDFAEAHPRATRGEWAEFAAGLAEEAYRTGFTRGVERTERTYDWRPDIPPEVLADMIDPAWRDDDRGIQIREAGAYVPAEVDSDEATLRRHVEEVFLTGARSR